MAEKKNSLITVLFSLVAIVFVVAGCSHKIPDLATNNNTGGGGGGGNTGNTSVPCDPNKVYFNQQVLPILISNCALSGCHDDVSHQDGVTLTSYQKVMSTGNVSPGRPGDSDLYEVLVDTDPEKRMPRPPQNPLNQQQIQIIYQWILQGAQNLTCDNLCDVNRFTYSGAIRALVSNKCQGCHSGASPQGNIDLSTYNGVKARVVDGKLWGAINHLPGFSAMPKNGTKLSECEIIQFRKWMDGGSPNN